MVALKSQGTWRWEGPLGTPLGLVHLKRASKEKASAALGFRAERRRLGKLSLLSDDIDAAIEDLEESVDGRDGEDATAQAFYIRDVLLEKMAALRRLCDEAEGLTPADCWPFPTYGELLFGV